MTEGTKNGRRTGARGHTTRQRKPKEQEDLGVQPLPLTPPVTVSQRKMEKPMPPLQCLPLPSFAPTDFAFNFEVISVMHHFQRKLLSCNLNFFDCMAQFYIL